ncbi:MAG TPA: DNA polymerase III subunit chi [Rhizomicrobium sp.]|nr:DNA polymerase III subunit chi [Rhizomicrobium sp.]
MEVLFYHLERRALGGLLPKFLETSLERGWRALIRCESAERAEAIDSLLWTYDEESFLPHGAEGEGEAPRQPVLITVEQSNANAANVLFLVGGASPPDWSRNSEFLRVVLMFEGRDSAAVEAARQSWKESKAAGHDVKYYRESPGGKFELQD